MWVFVKPVVPSIKMAKAGAFVVGTFQSLLARDRGIDSCLFAVRELFAGSDSEKLSVQFR